MKSYVEHKQTAAEETPVCDPFHISDGYTETLLVHSHLSVELPVLLQHSVYSTLYSSSLPLSLIFF